MQFTSSFILEVKYLLTTRKPFHDESVRLNLLKIAIINVDFFVHTNQPAFFYRIGPKHGATMMVSFINKNETIFRRTISLLIHQLCFTLHQATATCHNNQATATCHKRFRNAIWCSILRVYSLVCGSGIFQTNSL